MWKREMEGEGREEDNGKGLKKGGREREKARKGRGSET